MPDRGPRELKLRKQFPNADWKVERNRHALEAAQQADHAELLADMEMQDMQKGCTGEEDWELRDRVREALDGIEGEALDAVANLIGLRRR